MSAPSLVTPVLKWVGGKRQLLPTLLPLLPESFSSYCEPFVGGGALLFALQPTVAHINDINAELMNVYRVIRDDLEALLADLAQHVNEAEYFYALRDLDRDAVAYAALSPVQRASRIIYLNKTCFNGLFRVNLAGQFNTPFGRYTRPTISNEPGLRAVSAYLSSASITLTSLDYHEVLDRVPKDGLVYLDPPYDPVSSTSNFTGYAKGGFDRAEQVRLRDACDALHARGVRFMLSNASTPYIHELYSAYTILEVSAKRAINARAAKRGAVPEVVIRNYT